MRPPPRSIHPQQLGSGLITGASDGSIRFLGHPILSWVGMPAGGWAACQESDGRISRNPERNPVGILVAKMQRPGTDSVSGTLVRLQEL